MLLTNSTELWIINVFDYTIPEMKNIRFMVLQLYPLPVHFQINILFLYKSQCHGNIRLLSFLRPMSRNDSVLFLVMFSYWEYKTIWFFWLFNSCICILKSISSDISVTTPAFLWVPFAWSIVFYPFTWSLYSSLQLRCFSWRQHMIEFFLWFFFF